MNRRVVRRMLAGVVVIAVAILAYSYRWRSKPDATRTASSSTGDVATTSTVVTNGIASTMPSSSAVAMAPSPIDAAPRELASMTWGGGPKQIGRKRLQEGNAEGPMSLAVDSHGDAFVLDQVNGRLVKLGPDGSPKGTLKVGEGAQDVAVGRDGTVAVLDRLVDKNVTLYGSDGRSLGTLPVVGQGIDEGGQVTGVFVDGTNVYVEREHGQLVLIGTTRGDTGGDRTEIPGRPSRDGSAFVSAFLESGSVFLSATSRTSMQHRYTRALSMAMPMRGILLVDTDRFNTVYIATIGSGLDGIDVEWLTCAALEDGHVIGAVQVAVNTIPEETFREFAVLDDGGVLHAELSDTGVTYVRYDCR